MRWGNVCTGIDAAGVAWHPLGWEMAWLSEIDKAAAALLDYRFPDIPNLGDMTRIADQIDIGLVEAPDGLVGGTPCQGFSVAGRRGGLTDPRGQLTLSFVEIADAIDRARRAAGQPECVVLWENVPGVLSMRDNAFGNFLAALAGEDVPLEPSGKRWSDAGVIVGPERTIAWRVLDAQFFGLAQRRKRVFVVASARDGFDPGEVLLEWEGVRRDSPPSRKAGQGATHDVAESAGGRSHWDGDYAHPTLNQSTAASGGVGASNQEIFSQRGAYLVPDGHPLTNRVTFDRQSSGEYGNAPVASTVSARDFKSATDLILEPPVAYAIQERAVCENPDAGPDGMGVRSDDCAYTLEARAVPQAVAFVQNSRSEVRLIGGAGDLVGALGARTQFVPQQQTYVATGFQSSQSGVRLQDVAGTLDANYGSRRHNGAIADMAVRRLMPVECERLQGFPDGWTRIPVRLYDTQQTSDTRPVDMWESGEDGGWWLMAADGPRYKQLGNSMAVAVMRWIGRRIGQQVRSAEIRNLIG